jgi:hypothetical protein
VIYGSHAIPCLFIGCAAICAAQGDRAVFNFTGNDPARNMPWTNTTTLEPGLITAGWTAGPGLLPVDPRDDRIAFSIGAGNEPSTLGDARAAGAYLNVRFASSSGPLQLGLNRLRFQIRRESMHAPLRFAVFSSVDGFASPLFISEEVEPLDESTHLFPFFLPEQGFADLAGPVDFRMYPFAGRYHGHTFSLTGFSLGTAVRTHTLTTASTAGGTVRVAPADSRFEAGETVEVTAQADDGHIFAGWSGDADGRMYRLTLTMDADLAVTARFLPKAPPRMDIGGNLDALVDYSTAWVFKNCFKQARPWMTRTADGFEWESNQSPPTDPHGWPVAVPFQAGGEPQILHTLLPLYGPGDYTVRFQGTGRIELIAPRGGGRHVLTGTGGTTSRTIPFDPAVNDNLLFLEVRESSGADPVRDIEVIAPGQSGTLADGPFHPEFIASLAPYRNLRFLNWMNANNSPLASWSGRTTPHSYTQNLPNGGAHEYIIALTNQTRKDPWICLPHAADDDYVRRTARLFRDTLDPALELYVEYSNETWNTMFTQTAYVQDQGEAMGLSPGDRWRAGQLFTSRRSGEIFNIFEQEYGPEQRQRFVAVLATMAAGIESITRTRADAISDTSVNPSGSQPDALAIAPYFGVNYTPADLTISRPTANELATTVSQQEINRSVEWTRGHRALADGRGWRLICYEGGQHFTGIWGAENDDELTGVLHAANRDPEMQNRYSEYLVALEREGVDLFVNYSHLRAWTKWGSWSVLEHQRQPAAEAPKWRAITAWRNQLMQRRDIMTLTAPTIAGEPWTADFPLRAGRNHSVQSSTDCINWAPVDELRNLRGNGVRTTVPLPDSVEEKRFWRLVTGE